ncbi:hypothetical protein [Mucilaginibacter celer]|uniref:Uncharacterized protein n=1 Tax=Mucilaginibacter celer TaxID=2305508 RepID=A0A494VQI7_9SPHI|nr:hypothetical protein [Mucilaginibacter celer]AYL96221.1 hypothetical protein HYN43_013370 [Mucilaginibacter celer]
MELTIIMKLISVVLAISLASERLVTFLKTIIPFLAGPQPPDVSAENSKTELIRKAIVMLIAFAVSWVGASFLDSPANLWGHLSLDPNDMNKGIPFFIIAIMASGGSAIWTNLLGFAKAIKDIGAEKKTQEKFNTLKKSDEFRFAGNGLKAFNIVGAKTESELKTINFEAAFSGGSGQLTVLFENGLGELIFSNSGTKTLDLPQGALNYIISGSSSNGPGGGIVLSISGSVISNAPHSYGPGIIWPNIQTMIVT